MDFKAFLLNDNNKVQLCQLLLKVWSSSEAATRLEACQEAILIVNGKAHKLSVANGKVEVAEIQHLYSTQEETDTRVILYLNYAAQEGYRSAVVHTPDSDIFFILLYYADSVNLTIYLDTGTGKQ